MYRGCHAACTIHVDRPVTTKNALSKEDKLLIVSYLLCSHIHVFRSTDVEDLCANSLNAPTPILLVYTFQSHFEKLRLYLLDFEHLFIYIKSVRFKSE